MITYKRELFAKTLEESRPLQEAHWLETEGWRHAEFKPDLNRRMAQEVAGNYFYTTARAAGRLVGHCAWFRRWDMYESKHYADEDFVFVLPEFRNEVQQKLWEVTEHGLVKLGVTDFRMSIPNTPQHIRLWRRWGYATTTVNVCKRLDEQQIAAILDKGV